MDPKIGGTLCVFGSFEDSELYARNRALINALAACFEKTVEVRPAAAKRPAVHRQKSSIGGMLRLVWRSVLGFFSMALQYEKLREADVYFIPYPAYLDLVFLQLLRPFSGTPVVVDAFLCLHDTLVEDRRLFRRNGVAAKIVGWLEARTLKRADLVYIDTPQQSSALIHQYVLDDSKVRVTPVGIDESVWTTLPCAQADEKFRVLFWGTFIPLHGIATIVRAARILQPLCPRVEITLVGDGQLAEEISSLLAESVTENLSWRRELLSSSELRELITDAHCILGVFGDSVKAGNVVPYKAYQAMASNRILVSRRGPAFEELTGGVQVPGLFLVPPGDESALAQQLIYLCDNYQDISAEVETRKLYDEQLSQKKIESAVAESLAKLQ